MKNSFAVLLGVICLWATSATADDDALLGRHLRVQGQGVIQVTPDVATVSLGVEHRAATVEEAMAANNRAVASVLQALSDAGVTDSDVLTTELNIHRMVERTPRRGAEPSEKEVFVVRNLVQARIRDLGHLGKVIDSAVRAGANEMRGLRFGLSNDRPARDEARAAAAADARHRAEQLARLHDVQLGRVLRIAERDTGGARPEGMMIRMDDASVHTPVSVGDLSFRSGIEVIYELKD